MRSICFFILGEAAGEDFVEDTWGAGEGLGRETKGGGKGGALDVKFGWEVEVESGF